MLPNVGPNALGSRPNGQRRRQDEIRIQQEDPVKLLILPDSVTGPGAPFLASLAKKPALSEAEGWGFRSSELSPDIQKKNQSLRAKNAKPISAAPVLTF